MVVFGKTFGLMDLDSKLKEPTISDAITFWTCFCRQSLTLKTQRMGNSRGLSFKTDFGDPLIVRYCKVTLRVS